MNVLETVKQKFPYIVPEFLWNLEERKFFINICRYIFNLFLEEAEDGPLLKFVFKVMYLLNPSSSEPFPVLIELIRNFLHFFSSNRRTEKIIMNNFW